MLQIVIEPGCEAITVASGVGGCVAAAAAGACVAAGACAGAVVAGAGAAVGVQAVRTAPPVAMALSFKKCRRLIERLPVVIDDLLIGVAGS